MKQTGKFATKEQIEELTKLLKKAQTTPVIARSSADALSGNDMSSKAWKRVYDRTNQCAIEDGLPESDHNYGIDLETGEFLSMEKE